MRGVNFCPQYSPNYLLREVNAHTVVLFIAGSRGLKTFEDSPPLIVYCVKSPFNDTGSRHVQCSKSKRYNREYETKFISLLMLE